MSDPWASWLRSRRSGGDPATAERMATFLEGIRDRVLSGAAIALGDVVLDLGTGTGLIGLGALDRVGPDGHVVFSDVSEELLAETRATAARMGAANRSSFRKMAAEDVSSVGDGSVDAVTARSVLIFLPREQKRRAIAEAYRVLRPGGRLSVFEPINRVAHPEPDDRLMGFDVAPVAGLAARVKAVGGDTAATLLDFDQRDLLTWTLQAGFRQVGLDYEVSLTPIRLDTTDWDVLLRMAPNPLAPTLGEKITAALTPGEAARFASYLRPLVEGGAPRTGRSAVAYLRAVKT